MRAVRSHIAAFAIVCSLSALSAGQVHAANVNDCTWCHGPSVQGHGPAPRLAGQHAQYLENQLRALDRHTRDNPFSKQFMWGAAANVSPAVAREYANTFSKLSPKSADDGIKELVAAGRKLYERGNPDANIVSCAVCHGPKAQGIGHIPRLGGLSYHYLKRMLRQWRQGFHAAGTYPMPKVARQLSPTVVEELASYLSFVQ
jgi:cytochrome c553